MSAISYNLKTRVVNNGYNFSTYTIGGCFYIPDFEIINRKTKLKSKRCNNYNTNIKNKLLQTNNQIIIIGGSFPIYFSGKQLNFENNEYFLKEWSGAFSPTSKDKNMYESFKSFLLKLSKKNKVILIYPIPEVGWYPPQKLFNLRNKNVFNSKNFLNDKKNYLTTPYEIYLNRNSQILKEFDKIIDKNIYNVYPSRVFCNLDIIDRCLTHNHTEVYFIDKTHTTTEGSILINNLIMQEIEKIEFKSK